MKFDPVGYWFGYWTARTGGDGLFLSASVRVGYLHGVVDGALDMRGIGADLREPLRALSRELVHWYRAAKVGDKLEQHAASETAKRLMEGLGTDDLKALAPALHARASIAPGIDLIV